ncbi:hypothetical protein Tco_1563309 [Tanacetum coccineum]
MLSLGTMYEVSLIFKFPQQLNVDLESVKLITVKWRKEELRICSTNTVELTPKNWSSVKMWRFINHGPNAEFDVVIEGLSYPEFPNISASGLLIQGIEFRPIEMASFYLVEAMIITWSFVVCHEDIEGFKSLSISDEKDVDNDDDDDDEYWEKKLADGYQRYIEMSDKPLNHTTKKELYFLLCEGFLADNGHLWISLCKSTGRICSMLSATEILISGIEHLSIEIVEISFLRGISFTCQIQSHMFSPQCIYACYLVLKFEKHKMHPDRRYMFRAYYELDDIYQDSCLVHLKHHTEMDIPTINPKYGLYDTSDIKKTEELLLRKGHMQHGLFCWAEQREDGLMDEVMVCKPLQGLEHHKKLKVKLMGDSADRLGGMIVEGVEFRPYF